jgi:hypothetical protein
VAVIPGPRIETKALRQSAAEEIGLEHKISWKKSLTGWFKKLTRSDVEINAPKDVI